VTPAPRPVTTAAVERSGAAGVAVPAIVQGRQRAALAARLSASVSALPWREGDHVTAGTVVARLDDSALRSSVAAAEAAAKAAELDQARFETLVKEGTAAARDADESRARAAAAAAGLAAARENLAYAVLRAPFDGRVASRPANAGDVVSPGTTLIEIEGKGGLEVRATVEAEVVAHLRPGLTLEALVDGQPAPMPATVRAVSASGDAATHRFEVRADLPAAPGLRSGLFARLLVPSPSSSAPRIVVPESAVFQRGGLSGVFVVAKGEARLRWVAVGATGGGVTEVRAGLEGGERVALAPAGLVDGQPVTEGRAETR
jgi:RND family efflux transporter MFP subunit